MFSFINSVKKHMKVISAVTFVLILIICIVNRRFFSVEYLEDHMPEQPFMAAGFILLLYMFKTISVFFPIRAIQIASGLFFPKITAFAVNLLGSMIGFTAAYGFGRVLGADYVEKLTERYPKFNKIVKCQHGNTVFFCFLIRTISFIPVDIGSMYFGASKTSFGKYLCGSVLGVIPNVAIATYMGHFLLEPLSKEFIGSLCLQAAVSLTSMVFYYFYIKRHVSSGEGE